MIKTNPSATGIYEEEGETPFEDSNNDECGDMTTHEGTTLRMNINSERKNMGRSKPDRRKELQEDRSLVGNMMPVHCW